jgi:NAD-dependent DNA ligase
MTPEEEMTKSLQAAGVTNAADPAELEMLVMAHRYLYYIQCRPVLIDREYDFLDAKAVEVCPETSPVHRVGSDMESSYSPIHVAKAREVWKARRGTRCPF